MGDGVQLAILEPVTTAITTRMILETDIFAAQSYSIGYFS